MCRAAYTNGSRFRHVSTSPLRSMADKQDRLQWDKVLGGEGERFTQRFIRACPNREVPLSSL
eukprot:4779102-Pleurochrysis_carterae.AAC.2